MRKPSFKPKRSPTKNFAHGSKPPGKGPAPARKKDAAFDTRPFSTGKHKSQSGLKDLDDNGPRAPQMTVPKSWRHVAGTHAIMELINTRPKTVQTILLQNNWKSSAELREMVDIATKAKIKIEEKPEAALFPFCHSHQGAIAFSNENLEFDYENTIWDDHGLVIALDGVEDPHNLGAVLRTGWLMGANGVIIPDDRAVGLTATAHKVACGGAEHVPIYRNNQFQKSFENLKEACFWVYGLDHKATKTIYDIKFPEKVVLVLGAEDKGLRTTTEKLCDELICIPQVSAGASYNVSVSAALAIAETKRQWAAKK